MKRKQIRISGKIVQIEDAEQWMVDNKYLHRGYRKNFKNIKEILKSTIMPHNELMNIWTHLIGAIIFIGIFVYLTQSNFYGNFKIHDIQQNLTEFTGKTEKLFKHYNGELGDMIKHINWENTKEVFSKSKETISNLKSDIKDFSFKLKDKFKDQKGNTLKKVQNMISNLSVNFDQLQRNVNEKYSQLIDRKNDWTDIHYKELLSTSLQKIMQTLDKITPEADTINQMMSVFHQKLEIYPFFVYIATVIFCLMSSAIYHTFYPLSKTINKILHKFDMAGISILIFGSCFAMFYYYFYCMPKLRNFYCAFIFVNSFVTFGFSITDWINRVETLKWKSLMFASLGLSSIIPMTHLLILAMYANPENDYMPATRCFLYLVLMGAMYLGGLAIYATRVPERFYPKVFDIWLNSHTIWHVIVFFAALLHFYNLFLVYQLRLTRPCHYYSQ